MIIIMKAIMIMFMQHKAVNVRSSGIKGGLVTKVHK